MTLSVYSRTNMQLFCVHLGIMKMQSTGNMFLLARVGTPGYAQMDVLQGANVLAQNPAYVPLMAQNPARTHTVLTG